MHFARFQITAAAAEYFNRIRQAAKRIAHSRLTTGGIRPEKSVYTLDKAKMQRKGEDYDEDEQKKMVMWSSSMFMFDRKHCSGICRYSFI